MGPPAIAYNRLRLMRISGGHTSLRKDIHNFAFTPPHLLNCVNQ